MWLLNQSWITLRFKNKLLYDNEGDFDQIILNSKFYDFYFIPLTLTQNIAMTVAKISQERTSQDRSKISPFYDFLLHFLIFLLDIFIIALKLSCEAMFKISSKNIEKMVLIPGGVFLSSLYFECRVI